jgi:hypothetical protein
MDYKRISIDHLNDVRSGETIEIKGFLESFLEESASSSIPGSTILTLSNCSSKRALVIYPFCFNARELRAIHLVKRRKDYVTIRGVYLSDDKGSRIVADKIEY